MAYLNRFTRRDFLAHGLRAGGALGLASLLQVPPFARRALAEAAIGANGRKLLFIFLRGANDALNSCIPLLDPAYNQSNRPNIFIPPDPGTNYSTPGGCDFPTGGASTYGFVNAIRVGNGFNALHPYLKFLAPLYNAGDLALVHRVGYPRQSRSHFDSQAYWESGTPNSIAREGIFYRTLLESGLAATNPLAGVSVQTSLPTSFKGSQLAITNISDPTRYDLLGTPTPSGDQKLIESILRGTETRFADKRSRELLQLTYENLVSTLDLFSGIDFNEDATPGDPQRQGNYYVDDPDTDGPGSGAYFLFPTDAVKNGAGTANTNVVDAGAFNFFRQLKGAALVLNHTDAVIAGTEMGGFDTHNNQGGPTGDHATLLGRVGWALYALRKYFLRYGDRAQWDKLVVVTLSEFGRTTVQNSNNGTDHAEAGVMFVAGGGVKGFGKSGRTSGVVLGHPDDSIPWLTGASGSMFGVAGRYLRRAVDYRSVLGEIIREHLGATQAQLDRIIPGYAASGEFLRSGGISTVDNTPIAGEVDLV
jgi:uncharacterized protein (DUF1501 family)